MKFTHLKFEAEDGVATLTLNRPEARNALSPEMRQDLDAALNLLKAGAGSQYRVVILTGAGAAFCAGGDVKAMNARPAVGQDTNTAHATRKHMRDGHNRLIDLMNLELPVIVAVDGPAAGGGFNLALAGDIILASDRALFIQSFVRIGLVPDWNGLFLLPRIVGLQKAKEIMFSGRRIDAREAKSLGIVHSVYSPEELMPAARRMARKFCRAPTEVIGLTKNALNQSFHLDAKSVLELEAYAQSIAQAGAYHREATARFAKKEKALFDWDARDQDD